MIAAIEIEGKANGMLLNKGKCEALIFNKPSNVHFRDGTIVPKTEKAKYLGNTVNTTSDTLKETEGRIRETRPILQRLHIFWRHSN